MYLITPIAPFDKCSLLNVYEHIINEGLIVGCFLLGIVVINILLMNNDSSSNNLSNHHNRRYRPINRRGELSAKLLAQLNHNNYANAGNTRTYVNFPVGHLGHLTLPNQRALVHILRCSPIAGNYRFGSSMGKIYIKGTNNHPKVSLDMISVVLAVELG